MFVTSPPMGVETRQTVKKTLLPGQPGYLCHALTE